MYYNIRWTGIVSSPFYTEVILSPVPALPTEKKRNHSHIRSECASARHTISNVAVVDFSSKERRKVAWKPGSRFERQDYIWDGKGSIPGSLESFQWQHPHCLNFTDWLTDWLNYKALCTCISIHVLGAWKGSLLAKGFSRLNKNAI